MGKLSERDVEFIKYLADLKVPYRRIAEFHLKRRISHMTAYRVVHGKNVTASNTEPRNENSRTELVRDEIVEQEDHEPCNQLDFSQGLGSTLSKWQMMSIIRNSSASTKDIGIRQKILAQYLSKGLDTRLRKLLEAGSRTLKQLNLEGEPHLGDVLGRLLRKIYRVHYYRKKRNINYKRVIGSCLAYLLQWDARYESQFKPHLKIDQRVLREIVKLTGVPAQKV